MTMPFSVTDDVDLEGIESGASVEFTLLDDGQGGYRINSIRPRE